MDYNQQLLERVVKAYCDETGSTEFSKTEVAAWAIDRGIWKPNSKSLIDLLSDELSAAMRSKRKNVDGRKVREYHCVTEKINDGLGQTVWAHIDIATTPFMERSFARRRKTLASVAYQLHSDVNYWNENKNTGSPIQVLFDFTDDIADRDAALAEGKEFDDEEVEDADLENA